MAAFAYWFIGIVAVGMVMGLVNYAFTPRCETSYAKPLSYIEVLQRKAEMVISIPAQAEDSFGISPAAQAVEVLNSIAAEAKEMQIEYAVSEIPSEMEGSISELLAVLGGIDVEMPAEVPANDPVVASEELDEESEIPDWLLASEAEVEALDRQVPLEVIEENDSPNETVLVSPDVGYEFDGLEPPVYETSAPEGYEAVAFSMEELQVANDQPVSPSVSKKQSKGNIIPFPGVLDAVGLPDRAPCHIPYGDYRYINQLFGDLAEVVTTTPALGPRFAEDVMLGTVREEFNILCLEFRGCRIPISKNAKAFIGETVIVTGMFVSEQRFLAGRIQLAQEAAKAWQAV